MLNFHVLLSSLSKGRLLHLTTTTTTMDDYKIVCVQCSERDNFNMEIDFIYIH